MFCQDKNLGIREFHALLLCFSDGQSQMLGGCLRDFRNKPFPVRLRIEYYNKAISVSSGMNLTVVDADAASEGN